MTKHWPIIIPGYKFTYFFDTKVAYQWIVVMPTNKFYSDDFWDIRKALVVWHAINVFPALLAELLIGSQLPGLLIFSLQFV